MGLFDDIPVAKSTGLFDDIPSTGEDVASRLKNDQDFAPTPEEIARGYKSRFTLPDPSAFWEGAKHFVTETLPQQAGKAYDQTMADGFPNPISPSFLRKQALTGAETALRGTAYFGDMLANPLNAGIGEAAAEAQSPGWAMLRLGAKLLAPNLPVDTVLPRTPEQQSAAEQIWASRMRVAGEDARAMTPYHEGEQSFVPGAMPAVAELGSNFIDPTLLIPAAKGMGLLKLAGKGAEAASLGEKIARVAEEAGNTGGLAKKAVGVAAPAAEKAAQAVGRGAELVGEGLDKVQPILDIGGLIKGGLPGAAGAHVVGRTARAAVKWASKVRDASTGLRNIAKADWNLSWTVAQQLAKDADAPAWLKRAASSSVAPLVEETIRTGGAIGEGALHGTAIGGVASMANDTLTSQERGEAMGAGGVLGAGGAALGRGIGKLTGRTAAAQQAHDQAVMAHEAIQGGADPASVFAASDATMYYAHSIKQLFKGAMPGGKDLAVRLLDGKQFGEAHPNDPGAVASFRSNPDGTFEALINLDRPEADSRVLHEALGHALLESVVGNNPDAFERARAIFTPEELGLAGEQYATALHPELKGPDQQTWIAQQQANSLNKWGDRDAWILSELISEGAVKEAGGRSIRDMATPGFGMSLLRSVGLDKPLSVDTTSFFRGPVADKLSSPELGAIVRGRVEELGRFRPGIDQPKENSITIQKGDWGKKPFAPLHDLEKPPTQPPPLPRDPSLPPALPTIRDPSQPDAIGDWDRANRHQQGNEWFEGGKANQEVNSSFKNAADLGAEDLASHGMSKHGTLTGALNELTDLLTNNIDPNRGGGGLHVAPLSLKSSSARESTTAGGTSYRDGPFILVQSAESSRIGAGITDMSQVHAILVNEANIGQLSVIREAIHKIRPDILVEPFSNVDVTTAELIRNPRPNTTRTAAQPAPSVMGHPVSAPTPTPVPRGNDFVVVNPTTGAVIPRPPAQTKQLVRNRQKAVDAAVPKDVAPAPIGDADTQVKLRTSPSGLLERSGTTLGKWFYDGNVFSETTKNYARKIEEAIKSGTPLSGFYHEIGESARGWAKSVAEKYGNLKAEYKDFIPVGFLISNAGNLLMRNYSLTAYERKAQLWGSRKGPLSLEMYNGDLGVFRKDVQTYMRNHAEGRPGSDGIGEQKRDLINAFMVGGNRSFEATNPLRPLLRGEDRAGLVRSYRLDRLETIEPSDVTGFSKPSYEKQLRNLSPEVQLSPKVNERPVQVVDRKHAQELFDKGYRLFGAEYDGFDERPTRIKNAEDLQRYDPENIVALPPKKSTSQFSPATQTDTPEFKKWFKGSTVGDSEGSPLVMYHGTSKDKSFDRFTSPQSGIWFTRDREAASQYAKENDSRKVERVPGSWDYVDKNTADRVLPVFLSVTNPLKVEGPLLDGWRKAVNYRQANRRLVDQARQAGHDGLVFGDNDTIVAFNPTQIKSAIGNQGTFDAKNPDIRYSPGVPKDEREVILNLTSATGTLPGLDRLTREASGGDANAEKTLNGITHDALHLLTSGIPGVRVDIQDTRGVFGSSFEPAVQAVVKGTPESLNAALAAVERFARNFNQQEIHRREISPEGHYPGREHGDGSFDTPVFTFTVNRALTPGDITHLIEVSGLDALTQRGNSLEAYYAADPKNLAKIRQFERGAEKLADTLGGNVQSSGRTSARLWRYGTGENGTIPYERIRGDVRPEPTQQNAIAKRIAERLRGREVPGAPQAKEITTDQQQLQTRIAKEFEAAPMNELDNPVVAKAYRELADELVTQYEHLPVKIEVLTGQGEPYKSSAEMRKDVAENNHLFIFGTTPESFGPEGVSYKGHPLLEDSGFKDVNGKPLLKNDLLRAVHDYYAHTITPVEFGPKGEEAAWKNHMQMTKSPWARLALTTETRGQNSAVNFGKNAEFNRANKKDTIFADQKVTVLDPEFSKIGDPEADAQIDAIADQVRGRPQAQFSPSVQRELGTNRDFAKPPSDEVARQSLDEGKRLAFGRARNLQEGTPVGLRIDIPAFNRTGNYVISVHDKAAGGKVGRIVGYDSVARVKDPTFFVAQSGAERIAGGDNKFPVATVEGTYLSDRTIPADIDQWTPVGMNPKEHSYFYDKATDQPVVGGSEAVSVGNTVFVKNPVYGQRESFRFSPKVPLEPTPEYLERTPGARVYAAKLVEGNPHKYVNIVVAKKDTSVAKNALEGVPEKRSELYRRLDGATKKVAQDPVRLSNPKGYVEYMRDAGVSGDVMAPPAILKTLIETPQKYVDLVMGGYHGDKTKPGSLEAAMSGLDSTMEMRKAIGEKPPSLVSALHHFWGILSRQATPLDQEAAWLRLSSQPEVLEHIQKSIDGNFDLTGTEWDGVVTRGMKASAQSSNRIGNAVTSNANSFYLMLNRWNGKWDRVNDIYAAPNSIEMGRRFWSMGEGPVGIKNKVQRFVGLTFGTPGLIMDRWKFVEFYMGQFGKEPRDFFDYSATGTPGDPASLYAAYGGVESANPVLSLAFYEGMETALGKAIENSPELKQLLGRHANVGGLHWVGWNAIKNEAVGHSSLNMTYDLVRKNPDPKPQDVLELLEKNEYFTEGLSGNSLRRFSLKNK